MDVVVLCAGNVDFLLMKMAQDFISDQNTGYLLYIWDEILPSYMGVAISHDIMVPMNQSVQWNVIRILEFPDFEDRLWIFQYS